MTDYRTQNALDEQAAKLWHEADELKMTKTTRTIIDAEDELAAEQYASTVIFKGHLIDLAAARMLMDDDLCEAIHGTVETEQEFFDAYCAAHVVKYGEPFAFS